MLHIEKKAELRNLLRTGDKRCKLVEPKNLKSSVWRFFSLVSFDGPSGWNVQPYACCKTCGDLLSYSGKTGTGSLLRHKCLHLNNVSDNARNANITKAKIIRQPVRVAKPKLESGHAHEPGALPPKWEQYEHSEEISDDIKDIIYSEDPLCYSPIHIVDEIEDCEEKVNLLNASRAAGTSAMSSNLVTSTAISTAKARASNLETSLDRLSSVSEQMSFMIQTIQDDQNKDDDYYFALSLVPIMRQLSLNRKLYVRSKIQEILFKETEIVQPKTE